MSDETKILEKAEAVLTEAKEMKSKHETLEKSVEELTKSMEAKADADFANVQSLTKITESVMEELESELESKIEERLLQSGKASKTDDPFQIKFDDPVTEGEGRNVFGIKPDKVAILSLVSNTYDHNMKASLDKAIFGALEKAASVASAGNLDGAPVNAATIFNALIESNPFRGAGITVASQSQSYKLPNIANVAAAVEAAVGAPGNPPSAAITGAQINTENYVAEVAISNFTAGSFPGLLNAINQFMLPQAIGNAEADATVTAIKGVAAGRVVKTGNEAANLTGTAADTGTDAQNQAVIANVQRTKTHLSVPYRNMRTSWVMNTAAYDRVWRALSSRAGLAMDPRTGLDMLMGFPVRLTDQMDGLSANGYPIAIADWQRAIYLGVYLGMRMNDYSDTFPRAMLYDIQEAFASSVWDGNALSVLRIAA